MMPVGISEEDPTWALSSKGSQLSLKGQRRGWGRTACASKCSLIACVNGVARKKRRMLFGNFREAVEEMGLMLES